MARNALFRNDPESGRDRFSEVLAAAKSQGDERLIGVVINNLAESEFNVGNVTRAIELGREMIASDRVRRDGSALSITLSNVAAYLISTGETDEAHSLAVEALRKSLELQLTTLTAISIQHLAAIHGDHERAALLLGFTDSVFVNQSSPREQTEQREYDATLQTLTAALGEGRVAELLQRGGSLSEEQATTMALSS